MDLDATIARGWQAAMPVPPDRIPKRCAVCGQHVEPRRLAKHRLSQHCRAMAERAAHTNEGWARCFDSGMSRVLGGLGLVKKLSPGNNLETTWGPVWAVRLYRAHHKVDLTRTKRILAHLRDNPGIALALTTYVEWQIEHPVEGGAGAVWWQAWLDFCKESGQTYPRDPK